MRQIGVIDQYINDPGTLETESNLMLNLIQYKNAWICDNPLPVHLPNHESVDFQNFKSRTFNKNLVSRFVQEWQEKYDKNSLFNLLACISFTLSKISFAFSSVE